MKTKSPFAYFITFSCYGSRLHGNEKGSVDRKNNIYETPYLPSDQLIHDCVTRRKKHDSYTLDKTRRTIVLNAILGASQHYKWTVLTAHVRSNHIHVILKPDVPPEEAMTKIKRASSRKLNDAYPAEKERKKWARHGSTRYLWNGAVAQAAIHYVIYRQGRPMSVYGNLDFIECDINDFE